MTRFSDENAIPSGCPPLSVVTHRRASATTLSIVNAIMLAGTAHAQNAAGSATNAPSATGAATNAPTRLPDVVVQGEQQGYKPEGLSSPKYTEPLRDIPQTITVVPQAVIREQGVTTLRDALRNVTGISMQAGEGGGGLPGDNLSIRGFNARNDIYVDGIRDYGSYSRDLYNVDQISVAKGPSSAYGGRGSTGGSLNLETKTPQLDTFYAGTLGLGTDEYKRGTIDFNVSLAGTEREGNGWAENSALRLNAMWNEGDTPGRDFVENKRWAVNPALTLGLGTPTRLTLSYQHMTQENTPDYGIPWVTANNTNAVLSGRANAAPPVDYDNFYGIRGYDFEDIRNDTATARVDHDFNDRFTLRSVFRYAETERNSAITAPRFTDMNPGAPVQENTSVNRQLQRRNIANEIFTVPTDLTMRLETGPVEHTAVLGFEYTRENQDNRNSAQVTNQPPTDIFNPNPNDRPFGPMPPITGIPNHAEADIIAPYLFDTMNLGRHVELNGGLRWDHVEARYKPANTNELERTDDLLSWRAAVVFKPRENGSIYFGYGTAFNPSIDGNTGLTLSAATNSVNNIDLDPEETRSYELGTKWEFFNERLLLAAALFRTEKYNARTTPPGGGTVTLDGEQVAEGVELQAQGNITKDWRLTASYTYTETEVKESNTPAEIGAEFSNSPKHSASLWTVYDLPYGLQLGGGTQYVGERFNSVSSSATARQAPDYWLYDAMVAYKVNKNFTLRLNAYNLTDERYIDRIGGGHFVPGAGRSAMLTAEFKF